MMTPRFALPVGSEVTLFAKEMTISGTNEFGYQVMDTTSGSATTISFQKLVEHLKLPGARIDAMTPQTGGRLEARTGGFVSGRSLPEWQQEYGRFHLAIAQAMSTVRQQLRDESGNADAEVSIRFADANRGRIRDIAQAIFGRKIHLTPPRGGNDRHWTLYRGRTLVKYFKAYEDAGPNENPLDAVIRLDHLKGNAMPRVLHRLKELMTRAWEEVGLDAKNPALSEVRKHLEVLVREENARRARNSLSPLITPSASTVRAHRDALVTPLEYMIATQGERQARNKRGRGSSDIRALLIGEYVEIDECKASLVVSAKERGMWESLDASARAAVRQIDQEIRERLQILVMLDVASRMPLAWVISDQPRAEATLALFRMATRDKMREKHIYGCEGDPMPGVGIGHIKSDNGPGLRNSAVLSAATGIGAMTTIARAYASTDKPYVERMFGTTESMLLKMIHGYTGRKPGDLPGYDAVQNGILDIEALYAILTRFMIDEYPGMRHAGIGMGSRRPYEVFKQINNDRGCIPPLDPNLRRIQIGWQQNATPSDEGVRVFGGIWFNSDRLQSLLDEHRISGKVTVFVDPDDITNATVLLPKVKEPVDVQIQVSAFADMTLPEVLDLLAMLRKEDPRVTEIYEDRIMRLRRDRFDQLRRLGVEAKLKRSYSTIDECTRKAKSLLAGARIIPSEQLPGTTAPGSITAMAEGGAVLHRITDDDMLIDGHVEDDHDCSPHTPTLLSCAQTSEAAPPISFQSEPDDSSNLRKSDTSVPLEATKPTVLGRPKDLKELE